MGAESARRIWRAQIEVMPECVICRRTVATTRHHLIPRTRHSNKKNKRDFSRSEVSVTVPVCRPCHNQIHATLSEKELERQFYTIELLRNHPDIAKFAKWIANKPVGYKPRVRRSVARNQ